MKLIAMPHKAIPQADRHHARGCPIPDASRHAFPPLCPELDCCHLGQLFAATAEVAENRMGNISMGKTRASGMGPGRFMPLEMHNLGWNMLWSPNEVMQRLPVRPCKSSLPPASPAIIATALDNPLYQAPAHISPFYNGGTTAEGYSFIREL